MLPPVDEAKDRSAVCCALAAAFALGAARWGSYIGRSPLFLTDVLVLAGLVNLLATRRRTVSSTVARAASSPWVLPLVALLGWAVIRFVATPQLSVTAIRDFAPYGYAIVGIGSFVSYATANPTRRRRTAQLLEWAIYVHAAWVVLTVTLVPNLYAHLPLVSASQDIHLFEYRPDFDEAINGVAVALLLLRAFRGERAWLCLPAAALISVSIFQMENRGGFVGAALAVLIALYLGLTGMTVRARRKLGAVALVFTLFAGAVYTLPHTAVYQRIVATFTGSTATTTAADAAGTAGARRKAWSRLFHYDLEDQARTVVGVGFGPDFMNASGAEQLLIGQAGTDVRSPHNYWLGTFSREGIIGVSLFGALVLMMIGAAVRFRRTVTADPLLAIAVLVPAAIVPPATVGVILESPFGAVPFFWAAGILLSHLSRARTSVPTPSLVSAEV